LQDHQQRASVRRGDRVGTIAATGLMLTVISICITAIGVEGMLRVYHRKLFNLESITHGRNPMGIAEYDSLLGWVPSVGQFSRTGWAWTVLASGLRSNGRPAPATKGGILTVGDSFTFGDEVDDVYTWPSQLEGLLRQRVLNAGVFAYGIDQAYLRAEKLADVYDPRVIVLAFIDNDISRTQLSYYQRRWKPYFEYGANGLELRNVPVPESRPVSQPFPTLNRALGYSYLANTVLLRTPLRAWYAGPDELRVHSDGDRVTVELLTRLDRVARRRNILFLAVTLATDGRLGGNRRLPSVVARLRANDVRVVDLASEMLQMQREHFVRMFEGKGHYGVEMNSWVAGRLAAFLRGDKQSRAAARHGRAQHLKEVPACPRSVKVTASVETRVARDGPQLASTIATLARR